MPTRKKVIHALVEEIQVERCDSIVPVFRVPAATPPVPGSGVRTMGQPVHPAGHNTNPNPLVTGPTIRLAAYSRVRCDGYRITPQDLEG